MSWRGGYFEGPNLLFVCNATNLWANYFWHEWLKKAWTCVSGRKKLRNFALYQLTFQLANINKGLLEKVFEGLKNTDAQFVFALLVPILKKVTIFLISKVMNGVAGSDNERANFNLTTHINFLFGLFVAVILVGARPVTVACMGLVDAFMQAGNGLRAFCAMWSVSF